MGVNSDDARYCKACWVTLKPTDKPYVIKSIKGHEYDICMNCRADFKGQNIFTDVDKWFSNLRESEENFKSLCCDDDNEHECLNPDNGE